MQLALHAYQDAFAAALLADDPAADAPEELRSLLAQPGFAVYRNTVLKGCIDALQANFPTVDRLVGDEWFRAAAAIHARATLPSQVSLLVYGESFPDFLAAFEPAQELPYLADVARVDRAWTESHVAADDPLLEPPAVVALSPAQMATTGLQLHAATRWHWSDAWPIHALWSRNRSESSEEPAEIVWAGEGVLLTRPYGAVHCAALSGAGAAFLAACATGASIEQAVLAALSAEPAADIAALIHQLLDAGAFSALQPAQRDTARKEEE
ncbi:MAG TPA: DNA-binding domain-containing protein [Burkholderiaceae bacterium]|nr:DNA-binding domain-containing protein [Burkholderiaceae bacterium]